MLRKGAVIKLSNEAIENYGEEYKGKEFVVEHVATKYMPATEFFRRNSPDGYHPGYDESANGKPLYDLVGLEFSLYYWEVEFTGKYRTLEQD
jgi:hypothetical protein